MRRLDRSKNERGAVMPLVAIALVVLMGAAALTVDLGNGWQTRRGLINATDASALAAAQTYALNQGDGCALQANSYLGSNQPGATLDSCTRNILGPTSGWVRVNATQTANSYFGQVLGLNDFPVQSSTSALYGPISTFTGLRPFGICLAGSPALQAWIANPVGTTTITVVYSKDHPDACGSAMPGNWGTVDFDGGANSNADTKDWVLNGYPGEVLTNNHTVTSCVGEPHCYEGDTGSIAGLASEIQTLQDNGTVFTTPVFNFGEGTGGNVKFHLAGAIKVRILDFKVNGAQAARYFTFEVSSGLVDGVCCGGGAVNSGLRGVKICGVDPTDQSNCVLN